MDFTNKKLLVLAGAHQHTKLVLAAKRRGAYTIVTDYLADSPAKHFADKALTIDIKDVPAIVEMCKSEGVDGVVQGYIDPCQRPYFSICDKLGLPCYGTGEQFHALTDKHAFKKMCRDAGVDTIAEYPESAFAADGDDATVEYPVLVKPVDSRGSRGQTVCRERSEVRAAIEIARLESSNGDVLIEKYMGNKNEFQVTYFFINGTPYLFRTADRHLGDMALGLERVGICTVSPSVHTENYITDANENVVKMLCNLGIKNGPVFMQAFFDNGKFRFFDPGFRFPGGEFEAMYEHMTGISIPDMLVEFALTGKISAPPLPRDSVLLDGKRTAILFPTLRSGTVSDVLGVDEIKSGDHGVLFVNPKYYVGDKVEMTYNVNQRFAEIDVIGDNTADLVSKLRYIYGKLAVLDENGDDMLFGKLDLSEIGDVSVSRAVCDEYLV